MMTQRTHTWRIGIFLLALIALGWMNTAGAQDAGVVGRQDQRKPETLWSLTLKGGPVMIPLGMCSIMALALAIERGLSLRRRKVIPDGFIDTLKQKFNGRNEDIDTAVDFCNNSKSPVGNIFRAGILNLARGEDFVEKAIEDAGAREVDKMKRSLRGLSTIATISPLLGLLGTVYGMISAFQTATDGGSGKAELLARGIYEALVTTAAGLTIAIPVMFLYLYFNSRVDTLVDEIDDLGIEFMEHYLRQQPTRSKPS